MEDYALRFTPQRFRKWSEWRVANTAFGAASFLILEAVGATLLVQYGFVNAFWAILMTGLVIFLAGLPISVYAARYGVDMDLLTRGAGFGYIGSTLTSLIYASFTFIFFALEAAVMAYALELALDIPPTWGYLICAVVVIPLVTHGVSTISRLQIWTQPIWLVMLVVPFGFVLVRDPQAFVGITHYAGEKGPAGGFDLHLFGAALTVGIALMTQMGEQADYLRFMPQRTATNRVAWWTGVLVGGPGWVVLGVIKMLGGAYLAYLAIQHSVPTDRAVDPNQMYLAAYEYVFPTLGWAVAATAVFVVVSQLKINVTNAYAGSLAWSNFFSRLTHSHPGRVVWVLFNSVIAFMLMEMNVFQALGEVLGLYSNIAIAWIMAVVADLVINKPLGLSPKGIEFKRAHLYDINPVGVGAMAMASLLSILAYLGLFGELAKAFSAVVALVTAMVTSPLIAWWTQGKYYLARASTGSLVGHAFCAGQGGACAAGGGHGAKRMVVQTPAPGGAPQVQRCVICEREYEGPDMAHCPAYQGAICSLCCTLDARCGDMCKPHANLATQWSGALRWLLPRRVWPFLDTGLGHFLLLMLVILPILATVFAMFYQQELGNLASWSGSRDGVAAVLRSGFSKTFAALMLMSCIVAWWLVLAHKSRQVAQEESNRQSHLLLQEIESHRQTDMALQEAKRVAEQARQAAEAANQAKSRYISAISHELRTPLNSILGYAQLMGEDAAIPPHRKQAVSVIKRGGEHLLSLIEGTLDMAHIESGKLTLNVKPMQFANGMAELAGMFELQAAAKGLQFQFEVLGNVPEWVRADEKRLRQICINLLGNAIKFTATGSVRLVLRYAREMAHIEIHDTGPGMPAQELDRIFEPFTRGSTAASGAAVASGGSGLGLTIAKMLTDLMGGELSATSVLGQGSVFKVRLFLPDLHMPAASAQRLAAHSKPRVAYAGARRKVLVVDNEEADRELLVSLLEPLGFEVRTAASGHDCLDLLAAGLQPDVVLLDLAMPGIDGWETLRRIRGYAALGGSQPQVAIVSANAFDRGLDNGLGLPPEDFIVKPVRHSELLDWLERRLELVWVDKPAPETPRHTAPQVADGVQPVAVGALPASACRALLEVARLGYYRGVLNQLQSLQVQHPECAAFIAQQEALARQYQFETMAEQLQKVLDASPADELR
ncbi:ATP-binding protein [Rhodoferax sp.]|uniref:hybrid sensor histidine kinase/response regulator n=1 Tax=Rhodoferax sp. TaxID=50421 RepID=UPI0025FF80F1|nr:ATP-binding protein [Rhodoferax sp.]